MQYQCCFSGIINITMFKYRSHQQSKFLIRATNISLSFGNSKNEKGMNGEEHSEQYKVVGGNGNRETKTLNQTGPEVEWTGTQAETEAEAPRSDSRARQRKRQSEYYVECQEEMIMLLMVYCLGRIFPVTYIDHANMQQMRYNAPIKLEHIQGQGECSDLELDN